MHVYRSEDSFRNGSLPPLWVLETGLCGMHFYPLTVLRLFKRYISNYISPRGWTVCYSLSNQIHSSVLNTKMRLLDCPLSRH